MSAKEFRGIVFFILAIGAIVFLVSGATVNGKHYGVRDCGCERGVEIDIGEVQRDGGR